MGEGSTFWVEIPAVYAAPAADTQADARDDRTPRILVVDDDPTARYLIRHQLAAVGFRIIEAATREEGLARAARGPDAVLLDLSMPDLDGMEVYAALRADPASAALPIVIHTSRELTADEARLLASDGVEVVRKDAAPGSAVAALRSAIRSAGSRDGAADAAATVPAAPESGR